MKKIIMVVLAFALLMCTVLASEISDKQIETLEKFDVFEDEKWENESFCEAVTRAQFCKEAFNLVKWQNGYFKSEDYCFPDVPPEHPESGYISLLKEAGIICGYDDGNFYPDKNISYAEAAKITVKLLGYEPLVMARGGYPHGYLMVMQTLNLQRGFGEGAIADADAKKGNLAIMLINAIDTPLMEQTVWTQNGEVEYKIMNGKNGTELVTPRIKLDNIQK